MNLYNRIWQSNFQPFIEIFFGRMRRFTDLQGQVSFVKRLIFNLVAISQKNKKKTIVFQIVQVF